jgi:transcriptional regulator with XRE-family HTH domain
MEEEMGDERRQLKMDNISFANHVLFDFIDTLDSRLEELGLSRREFASKLGVTEGRISQVFNNPANFTMRKMVEWSRILGLKVSLVSFEDKDDPSGAPVFSTSFKRSWEILGRPKFEEELNKHEELCKDCVGKRNKENVVWLDIPIVLSAWDSQESNQDLIGATGTYGLPLASFGGEQR